MSNLQISPLAQELRSLVDTAKKRLWIVSPYIGSWNAVRRVLGEAWEKVDVKLLTDKESGILARDTLERFEKHRPVKSLKGVHAKLYIVDDSVLLTSANLTEAAFTKRYEAGRVLTGQHAQELVAFYELLWSYSEDVDLDSIQFTKSRSGYVDENSRGGGLTKLFVLPAAPAGTVKGAGEFADYPYFLEKYNDFVAAYLQAGARDERKLPLFFETDKFLNYLYHDDPEKPSRAYKDAAARSLSASERVAEIRKYRTRYRRSGVDAPLHLDSAEEVQRLLAERKILHLTQAEIKAVAECLNCFGVLPLAKARFVNGPPANSRWLRVTAEAGSIGHATDIAASASLLWRLGDHSCRWARTGLQGKNKSCRRLKAWGLPIPDWRL